MAAGRGERVAAATEGRLELAQSDVVEEDLDRDLGELLERVVAVGDGLDLEDGLPGAGTAVQEGLAVVGREGLGCGEALSDGLAG